MISFQRASSISPRKTDLGRMVLARAEAPGANRPITAFSERILCVAADDGGELDWDCLCEGLAFVLEIRNYIMNSRVDIGSRNFIRSVRRGLQRIRRAAQYPSWRRISRNRGHRQAAARRGVDGDGVWRASGDGFSRRNSCAWLKSSEWRHHARLLPWLP